MTGLTRGLEAVVGTPGHVEDGLRRWDGMAMEAEYAELLMSLVASVRPALVVECGAGRGITSVHIAHALSACGGRLVSYEPLDEFRAQAAAKLRGLPATVLPGSSLEYSGQAPDLVFVDSGPDTRTAEIERWLRGDPSTLVVIHDANRNYPLHLGTGVLLTRGDGLWVGRAG